MKEQGDSDAHSDTDAGQPEKESCPIGFELVPSGFAAWNPCRSDGGLLQNTVPSRRFHRTRPWKVPWSGSLSLSPLPRFCCQRLALKPRAVAFDRWPGESGVVQGTALPPDRSVEGGRVTAMTGVPWQPRTFYMGVTSGGHSRRRTAARAGCRSPTERCPSGRPVRSALRTPIRRLLSSRDDRRCGPAGRSRCE